MLIRLTERFMQVNTKAPLELVQAVVPHFPAKGRRIISMFVPSSLPPSLHLHQPSY
jgi:NAD(P)-dependent dehydrogenase (short-subunit alcohol dehydrogenase family)